MKLLMMMAAVAVLAKEGAAAPPPHAERILRFDRPATDWQSEALPLGNGRLGCMVYGGVEREQIQFNEDSLWIGDESDTGAYQAFGDLYVDFSHQGPSGYARQLDLRSATYTQRYECDETRFTRRYFASYPAQVLVFHFTADRPGAYSGRVSLVDAHGAAVRSEGKRIVARGDLRGFVYGEASRRPADQDQYQVALRYEAGALVLHQGGEAVPDAEGGITFTGCDSLTILLGAGTDFVADRSLGWTGEHPHRRVASQLDKASRRSIEELHAEHQRDFESLFGRMSIALGSTPADIASAPTNRRVAAYSADGPDHDLEELLFQYARYLMISCSRPGARPANLQGLWNNRNDPIWRCDYHSDVNTEMNYWFTDAANLAECFAPLAEWVNSIREVRRDATFLALGKPGWALRAENGLFGGSTWQWSKGDASWLAQNLWDHYAFTRDKAYLRDRVYPVQRDLCEFWLADLKETADGALVSPLGFSPEHGPHEDGVSFDQQLVWDLFTNTIEASVTLGVDNELRGELLEKRGRLLGPQVGRWGQLQEWAVDRDDPSDDHRHVSHMIAVHPGRQISPDTTPRLAEAAGVSLAARPDGSTGWSKAWKTCIWARLHQGDRAYHQINRLFADGAVGGRVSDAQSSLDADNGGVMGNLLNSHPPFQIDGNFGYAAGVCEMLVQSHLGYVQLLPALPTAWPDGRVSGICARGGFEIDMQWREGALIGGIVRSRAGGEIPLLCEGMLQVSDSDGPVAVQHKGPLVVLPTAPGQEYVFRVLSEDR